VRRKTTSSSIRYSPDLLVNSQYTDLRFIHVNCTALQYSPQQQFLGQLVCVRGLLEERHYRRSGNVFLKKISGEFFYQATGQSQRHSQVSDPSMKSFAMAIPSNFFQLRGYKFRTAKWTIALPPTIPNNGLPTIPVFMNAISRSGVARCFCC